ncbi:MAG TPA: questin oxidase family protein [Pyrinomonadaceae bacterium]|nr:questin oxidase family protein [Pyrinomonadaceae bacterium]
MTQERTTGDEPFALPRRRFVRDAAAAATAACLSPGLLLGCRAAPGRADAGGADAMEQALEMMRGLAPLTNHGPMAAEALVALGRAGQVVAWVEGYRRRFTDAAPRPQRAVTRENWREALGDGRRVADWTEFFERELKEAAWTRVIEQWSAALAPGLAAAAAHGLIRTAHAARSLSVRETALRRGELAAGLGYWAAYYQPLPEATAAPPERLRPAQALGRVPLLPAEKRRGGSIMNALRGLEEFAPFAAAADLVGAPDEPGRFLSELTETFAGAYVERANRRNRIVLLHAVTGTAALRSLLPHLSPETARKVLRYGWQVAAALYSIAAGGPADGAPAGEQPGREDLIDRAVATEDEHAIKLTEACLREHALNPRPVYLRAALDAATQPMF